VGRSTAPRSPGSATPNNVLASWVHAKQAVRATPSPSPCPDEYGAGPGPARRTSARPAPTSRSARIRPRGRPGTPISFITDTWVSMGDTDVSDRRKVLKPYRVDTNLLGLADKDALFMHCLPGSPRRRSHRRRHRRAAIRLSSMRRKTASTCKRAILCWCFGIETV